MTTLSIIMSLVASMIISFSMRYLASKDIMEDGATLHITKKMAIVIGFGIWIAYIALHLCYAVLKG